MEINFGNEIIWQSILEELRDGALIFIPTLAVVYIFGRMLGILKTYRTKNTLALVTNFLMSYFYVNMMYDFEGDTYWMVWNVFYKGCLGILLYVLVGFKLFDRMDHLLDKKIADDKEIK
jgi:hypothetical protein